VYPSLGTDCRLDVARVAGLVHARLQVCGVHAPDPSPDDPFPMHSMVSSVLERLSVIRCDSSFQLLMNMRVLHSELRAQGPQRSFCGSCHHVSVTKM